MRPASPSRPFFSRSQFVRNSKIPNSNLAQATASPKQPAKPKGLRVAVFVNPADATATPDAVTVAPAKGTQTPEQKWRQAFAAQRAKIAQAEKELDVLQREESKAGLQYYSDPTKAMKEQLTRNEINEKAAKIAAKKQQIADLKRQMDDMEDQLRKEGGDPGWAR